MLRDFVELIRQTPLGALPSYAGQPVAQGDGYSFRLGLARKLGECLSKSLRFRVPNIDSHLELYVKIYYYTVTFTTRFAIPFTNLRAPLLGGR